MVSKVLMDALYAAIISAAKIGAKGVVAFK
jgi:hypothetical protein